MESYKFAVPVRVIYIADESTISIMSLEDLEEVQEKYNVDLEFVINEFEYKVDMEKDAMEDDDYMGMGEDEIFDSVIEENWDDIIKKLNKDCKLDDLNDEDIQKIFDITKENFDKNVSLDSFDDSYQNQNYKILSALFTSYNRSKSEFYIEVSVDRKLKKNEIEWVRNWVETITSEDWGLKFSKTDLSDKLETEDVYVYLIPWSLKKDVKYIKA